MSLINNKTSQPSLPRKRTLSSTIRFGIYSLVVYTCVFTALVLVMYVVNFNSASTKGYELKRLEIDRQDLLLSTEQQALQISEAKSVEDIKNRTILKYMVKSGTPLYMRTDTAVAFK